MFLINIFYEEMKSKFYVNIILTFLDLKITSRALLWKTIKDNIEIKYSYNKIAHYRRKHLNTLYFKAFTMKNL